MRQFKTTSMLRLIIISRHSCQKNLACQWWMNIKFVNQKPQRWVIMREHALSQISQHFPPYIILKRPSATQPRIGVLDAILSQLLEPITVRSHFGSRTSLSSVFVILTATVLYSSFRRYLWLDTYTRTSVVYVHNGWGEYFTLHHYFHINSYVLAIDPIGIINIVVYVHNGWAIDPTHYPCVITWSSKYHCMDHASATYYYQLSTFLATRCLFYNIVKSINKEMSALHSLIPDMTPAPFTRIGWVKQVWWVGLFHGCVD